MRNFSTFVVLLVCFMFATADIFKSKPLPSYITACNRADPTKDDCSKKSAIAAIPILLKGDKDYKIPNLLPLKVPKLALKSGDNLELTFTDVSVYGLDRLLVDKLMFDPAKKKYEIVVKSDWISMDGQYTIKGQILVLPISGAGPANLTFYDNTYTWKMDYDLVKRNDGKEYLRIANSSTDIDIPRAYFHLENLFNGNKELGEHMNNFLNENSKDAVKDLAYPVVAELIQVVVLQVFTSIINVVPYDDLLPV